MGLRVSPAPFQRNKRTTFQIMVELSCVLLVVLGVSIVFHFLKGGVKVGLSALLIAITALLTGLVIDVICALIFKKRKFKEIVDYVLHSYTYVTALIFSMTVCASTNPMIYYAVIVGMIFATVLGKVVFGGFGNNIVNPAGIGRMFIGLTFGALVSTVPGIGNGTVDGVTGSTVTAGMNWITGQLPAGFTIKDLFFGNYFGAIGETFAFVLIPAGIYLMIRQIIDYRITLSYLLTAFVLTFILGFVLKVDFPLTYAVTRILSGGLLFGAIFMLTDPVTAPNSPLGQLIYGIGAATLTVIIRVFGSLPEGVVFSIILMNLAVPVISSALKGQTDKKLGKQYAILGIFFVVCLAITCGIGFLKVGA